MKYISTLTVILIFFSFLFSCKNTDGKAGSNAKDSTSMFLSLFPDIKNVKAIHFYSPTDTRNGHRYVGIKIGRGFYQQFAFNNNFTIIIKNILEADTAYYHLYSCGKINLSAEKTGLIVRWPSQYSETALYLFIWDNQSKKIISQHDLTDEFGDEGWYFVRDAWLTDLNNDNMLDIITREKNYNPADDEDSTSKASVTDSLFVFLFKDGDFVKTPVPIDTAKFNLFNWK